MKIQGHSGITVIVDLHLVAIEQESIFLAREMIAPQALFAPHYKIGVLFTFCPGKRRWSIETNPLSSKGDFARFQNDQKDRVADRSPKHGANAGSQPRIRVHQSRHRHAGNDSRDDPANRHPIWNDEMLKVDKCSDDEKRNENPVRDRHLQWKTLPDREEKERGEQFHSKIAKRDLAPAICTTAAEQKPADQRQILTPGDRCLASRAKRAARLVDRKIDRQTVNADV